MKDNFLPKGLQYTMLTDSTDFLPGREIMDRFVSLAKKNRHYISLPDIIAFVRIENRKVEAIFEHGTDRQKDAIAKECRRFDAFLLNDLCNQHAPISEGLHKEFGDDPPLLIRLNDSKDPIYRTFTAVKGPSALDKVFNKATEESEEPKTESITDRLEAFKKREPPATKEELIDFLKRENARYMAMSEEQLEDEDTEAEYDEFYDYCGLACPNIPHLEEALLELRGTKDFEVFNYARQCFMNYLPEEPPYNMQMRLPPHLKKERDKFIKKVFPNQHRVSIAITTTVTDPDDEEKNLSNVMSFLPGTQPEEAAPIINAWLELGLWSIGRVDCYVRVHDGIEPGTDAITLYEAARGMIQKKFRTIPADAKELNEAGFTDLMG